MAGYIQIAACAVAKSAVGEGIAQVLSTKAMVRRKSQVDTEMAAAAEEIALMRTQVRQPYRIRPDRVLV